MGLDGEAACVACESLGGLGADRACAFEQRRCVVAEVHDQRGGTAPDAAVCAAVSGEGDERISGVLLPFEDAAGLLVQCALRLGDVPDGLLEGCALLQRQAPAQHQLTSPAGPVHAQGATGVQLLVVVHGGRSERASDLRDRAGCLAERHARELRIALGSRELGGGCHLVEGQLAGAEGVVERGQVAQRVAGVRDAFRGAVVAA